MCYYLSIDSLYITLKSIESVLIKQNGSPASQSCSGLELSGSRIVCVELLSVSSSSMQLEKELLSLRAGVTLRRILKLGSSENNTVQLIEYKLIKQNNSPYGYAISQFVFTVYCACCP